MLLTILTLLATATQAQNTTQKLNGNGNPTQIAVYPPFPIRSGSNMQHTQRAYDVSLITIISSTTLVYAISCSPQTIMTRFNDVCGTSFVPSVVTVTQAPDLWQWTAQGKTLYCTNLSEKIKTCTSVTNNLESYFAPVTGTQDSGEFLAGFLEYFTTMTPVAVNVTAGWENVPATVLASLRDDATSVAIQTDGQDGSGSGSGSGAVSTGGPTGVTAPVLTVSESSNTGMRETVFTGAAPRATGGIGREMLFGAGAVAMFAL